jgi:hypothetical protein
MNSLDLTIQEIAEQTASKVVYDKISNIETKIDGLADVIIDRLKTGYSPDDILNTVQAAKCLSVSPQTVINWRNKGVNLIYHIQDDKEIGRAHV